MQGLPIKNWLLNFLAIQKRSLQFGMQALETSHCATSSLPLAHLLHQHQNGTLLSSQLLKTLQHTWRVDLLFPWRLGWLHLSRRVVILLWPNRPRNSASLPLLFDPYAIPTSLLSQIAQGHWVQAKQLPVLCYQETLNIAFHAHGSTQAQRFSSA